MSEIRLLGKEDIEVRVAQTSIFNNNGQQVVKVNLLLYKDARVDMKILDELYTPMGWKRTHKLIGDRLYCQVEVWDSEKKEWICKEDVGVESNTEAEKGQASDSFKRACVNWGIGRELYTAPRISVELAGNEYTKDQNSRVRVWASFSVKSIGYDVNTRTITSLEIQDKNGNVRFVMGSPIQPVVAKSEPSPAVQARRAARRSSPKAEEPAQATPAYTPVDDEVYWKIIGYYCKGVPSKSGDDYLTAWTKMTNATEVHVLKFLSDVDSYCAAHNLQRPNVAI